MQRAASVPQSDVQARCDMSVLSAIRRSRHMFDIAKQVTSSTNSFCVHADG